MPLSNLARLTCVLVAVGAGTASSAEAPMLVVERVSPVPAWALAQRALLAVNAEGAADFAAQFLDARGYWRGPERWGVSDGPDDTMEVIGNWPLAHALGSADALLDLWAHAWEGHLDQFSRARVPGVELARDGIYHKEFITSFDWEHTGEGLTGFYAYGLSRPNDPRHQTRLRRFAGFYLNEDPAAPNYDPTHKIIRSLFNGSRGPKLTPATTDDWDGEPVPGANPERRRRFLEASNIRGDHPLNLAATNLALQAFLATGEAKYRQWLLEYVDAWAARAAANGGNIPSNIGLDGTIGGEWGGRWYGGVFGWNSPDTGVRNYVLRGPPEGFGNALLLTGDGKYSGVIRRQIDNLYAAAKVVNGRTLVPRYYGDGGWYGHHDGESGSPGGLINLRQVETDLYLWTLDPAALARLPKTGWIGYLQGKAPDYPLAALQQELEAARRAGERMRQDRSSFDYPVGSTRGANANPVQTAALVHLTLGGNDPGGSSHGPLPLHTQVRHFDPERRRAGLPEDVAALVERIAPDSVTLQLVNTNPLRARTVTVQMGGYGEHRCTTVRAGERVVTVNGPAFTVRLLPGASDSLVLGIQRYAHAPTLAFPWDRGWMLRP